MRTKAIVRAVVVSMLVAVVLAIADQAGAETDEGRWMEAVVVPKLPDGQPVSEGGATWKSADPDLSKLAVEAPRGKGDAAGHLRAVGGGKKEMHVVSSTPTTEEAVSVEHGDVEEKENTMKPAALKPEVARIVASEDATPAPLRAVAPFVASKKAAPTAPATEPMHPAAVVPDKLHMDLFVMALCPYCRDWILSFNQTVMGHADVADRLDIRVRFVVRSNNTENQTGHTELNSEEFRCLHGERECDVSRLMLCAMRATYESGRRMRAFWPFLAAVENAGAANTTLSFKYPLFAQAAGIDSDAIDDCLYEGQLSQHLLLAEALYCKRKGVFATPTVFYNGNEYKSDDDDYLGQVCQAMREAGMAMPRSCEGVKAPVWVNQDDDGVNVTASAATTATAAAATAGPAKDQKKEVEGMQEEEKEGGGVTNLTEARRVKKEVDNTPDITGKPMEVPPPASPPAGHKSVWKDLVTRGFKRALTDIEQDITQEAGSFEGVLLGGISGTN